MDFSNLLDDVARSIFIAQHRGVAERVSGDPLKYMSDAQVSHFRRLASAALKVIEQTMLGTPPPGWSPFGSHIDDPTRLVFYGAGEDGLPIWECPDKEIGVSQGEATVSEGGQS